MKIISISVEKRFLSRNACLEEAERILKEGLIDGMSRLQLARELYFHAKAYYFCKRTGLFRWIRDHAEPIDIENNGDTLFRRIVYWIVWLF